MDTNAQKSSQVGQLTKEFATNTILLFTYHKSLHQKEAFQTHQIVACFDNCSVKTAAGNVLVHQENRDCILEKEKKRSRYWTVYTNMKQKKYPKDTLTIHWHKHFK